MLYDPKWEVQTKPDVFSLESLIAWLEKMPASAQYCWDDGGECLLGQWLSTIDPKFECDFRLLENIYRYTVHGETVDLSALAFVAYDGRPHDTFGAALERARAAL